MKNNRLKTLLSIFIVALFVSGVNVEAEREVYVDKGDTNLLYAAEGYPCRKPGGCINYQVKKNGVIVETKDFGRYYDSYIWLNMEIGGQIKKHEAYCIDPDLSMNRKIHPVCAPYAGDAGMEYLFSKKDEYDHTTFLLALRLYAVQIGLNNSKGLTNAKAAIIRYFQIRYEHQLLEDVQYGGDTNDEKHFIWGDDDMLNKAYELAIGAIDYGKTHEIDLTQTDQELSTIHFAPGILNGDTMTYKVTATNYIDPEKMEITCDENCTVVGTPIWNGTSGSVTVKAKKCDEPFHVMANYGAPSGLYSCTTNTGETQTLIVEVDEGVGTASEPGVIPCGPGKCCQEDPVEPGFIEGSVFNCCTDNTVSEAHEYDLNKLFCRDNDLKVDHYLLKCTAGSYDVTEDTKLNDKYCKMYCTERVSVEIPGAITATSGRYFKLSTTSHGTKSPYIEGFKRCRIIVDYQKWEKDYGKKVENQVDQYNTYQEKEAYRKMYDYAINNNKVSGQSATSDITCGCSCNYTYKGTCYKDNPDGTRTPYSCDKPGTKNATPKKDTCTINYNRYNFTKFYNYYFTKINPDRRNNYSAYLIEKNGGDITKHPDPWSAWEINDSISRCDTKTSNMQTTANLGVCSCTYSCTRTKTEPENHIEDVYTARSSYQAQAQQAETMYNAAANEAKKLEEDLDRCDNYFTKYEGANPDENFKFQSTMDFYYTQVYLDENGEKKLDEQFVTFEEKPGCVVYPPTVGPDGVDHLEGKGYSEIYSASGNFESMNDFGPADLEYEDSALGYKDYIHDEYKAEKLFRHDAKYRAECSWNEGDNKYHTLVPNGAANENTSGINFTEHDREYRVYLTTFDGTYETYWNINGLGSVIKGTNGKGKFDDYFRENGTHSCSNQSPEDTTMMTCKLHVEYEIVLTGYCNGSNGTDTTIDLDDCDPYKEGMDLFNFRVVDPVELFPSGTTKEGQEFAHNWVKEDKGVIARKEIQERAKLDKTYAPSQVTYSFTLTPTDMQHIKNYNQERINYGGYSDFELDCSCGASCNMCKSRFVDSLSKGHVKYDSRDHDVTGWTNKNSTLTQVRDRLLR